MAGVLDIIKCEPMRDSSEISRIVLPARTKLHPPDEKFVCNYLSWFANAGALNRGHFEMLDGTHSEFFFRFSKFCYVDRAKKKSYTEILGEDIAELMVGVHSEYVFGLVTAGGLSVHPLARRLKAEPGIFDVGVDYQPSGLRAGYKIEPRLFRRRRVLLVDDAVASGEKMRAMASLVRKYNGKVVGLASFATLGESAPRNLEQIASELGVPALSLVHLNIASYPKDACPLCKTSEAVPVRGQLMNS